MKKTEAGEYQISKAKSYKAVLHPNTEAQFRSHTSSYLRDFIWKDYIIKNY